MAKRALATAREAPKSVWTRRHLLGLEELSREELLAILDTAESFKEVSTRSIKKVPALQGKVVVLLFFEPSTRTATSFNLAAKRLSADVVSFSVSASSVSKGETFNDTAKNIEAMGVDIVVVRHTAPGAALLLSRILEASVVNAGDGSHEHPTQGLLDIFTIREAKGRIEGLKVAIVGDILYSRVARSNIWALTKLEADVTLVGPSTLVPHWFTNLGVKVSHDLKSALADAEVVMLLRIQHERQTSSHFPSLGEYTSMFGLNKTRASWLNPKAIIMHPGPINRGVEIDSELADSSRSVILEQVQNGLAVRMAALYLCAGGHPEAVLTNG